MSTLTSRASDLFVADRIAVDDALMRLCDRHLGDRIDPPVAAAIRYCLEGEGKRIRAILLLASYRAAGGGRDATALAAAVEVVHAYSLVHDDLPCMDDDDVRRGRPTVHRAFGVPVATAAGVAMVPLASLCAWEAARELELPEGVCSDIVRQLMRAAGAGGMIGGQLLDLEGEGRSLSLGELEAIHRAKTGALIGASVRLGALAARANEAQISALDRFGEAVGLAFQIADDVLDVTSTTDELGKTAGKDAAVHKSTYPALLGVEGAKARADGVIAGARSELAAAQLLTPELDALARYMVVRRS